MIISISGIDGCGKTSIIKGVRRKLKDGGHSTQSVWLRYNHYLTKILLVFCRMAGLTHYEYPDGVRVGYHEFYRSRLVSWLFIAFTYIDTFLTGILLVRIPSLLTSRVIVCDRWVLDIMIDLEVDTRIHFSAGGWLERLFRSLMPGNVKCFLIMRDETGVLSCRPENMRDRNFQRRQDLYKEYSARPWVTRVDNDGMIEDAVGQVVACIEDTLH